MRHAGAVLLVLAVAGAAVVPPAPAPRPAPPELRGGIAAMHRAPLPVPRPPRTSRPAAAPVLTVALDPARALCGDARLRGARVPAVDGAGACGIAQPVRLSGVAGVRLLRPVTVGCEVAQTLADWVETVAHPAALAETGQALVAMTPAAGYACRGRNRQKNARLSEHARGKAIDISGFVLAGGREVRVEHAWNDADRPFALRLWRGACGPFGTVLGPDSDGFHDDHFHFDVADHRSGPYCR